MPDIHPMRTWYLIHRWTSLICTAFLLVLCISGLPLIFSDEIEDWLDEAGPAIALQEGMPAPDLDEMVKTALGLYPGHAVRWIVLDKEHNPAVTLAPSLDADPKQNHWVKFDARSGQVLKDSLRLEEKPQSGFMTFMLRLHTSLFAGLAGELFLGMMGLLFVVALVSGTVLYGPYMKKLDFGTVRTGRAARLTWLDLHNLLGIVTLAWAFVVGVTGVINELSTPLFGLWRTTEIKALLAPYHGKPMPQTLSPVQTALDTVQKTMPGKTIFSIVYPEPEFGSPYHYLVWVKGDSPLTSRLFTPLLIDANNGQLSAIAHLPWYLKLLEVSRPLHFGDYGGMPLKILWAIFDLVVIVVLVSGLYLWLRRSSRLGKLLK